MSKAVIALAILAIVGVQAQTGVQGGTLTDGDITVTWNFDVNDYILLYLQITTTSDLSSYYAVGLRNGTDATGLQGAEYCFYDNSAGSGSVTVETKYTTSSSDEPQDDDLSTFTGSTGTAASAEGTNTLIASCYRPLSGGETGLEITEGGDIQMIVVKSDNANFNDATYSETTVTLSEGYSGEADDNAISIALSFALVGILNLF